jgi:tetratricopeptide (TPR) repeat protein
VVDGIIGLHLTSALLARLVSGQLTAEEERVVGWHLQDCEECRGRALDGLGRLHERRSSLRGVAARAEAQTQNRLAILLSQAEWEALRRLPKAAQKGRVVLSRACHTKEFIELLLSILKKPASRQEAESVAKLASLAIKGLEPKKWSQVGRDQLMAQVWIELANSRRLAAEWDAADTALQRAKVSLGDERLLQARWLSVSASLQSDKGYRAEALETLNRCRQLYEGESEWAQVARTLVQMGNFLVELDPLRGLAVLDQARPLIPERDPVLLWLLESARTDCFIETNQRVQALSAFLAAEELRGFQTRPRADIRGKFTAGRLLEAYGYRAEAERLFEEVVSADLEHSLLKDAFLDLLYLFAFYVKGGESDRAAALGRRALTQLELLDSIHEQLRDVWQQLIVAAERKNLDLQALPRVREYLRIWWKRPGPDDPYFAPTSDSSPHAPAKSRPVVLAESEAQRCLALLLAYAEWEALRKLPKGAREDRLALSRDRHTRELLGLLLSNLKKPSSRHEAESVARLASLVIKGLEPTKWTQVERDRRMAQVWIELANSCRLATEWEAADAALQRAKVNLGDERLLQARWLSVSASLQGDKGYRTEALETLNRCRQLYESESEWPQVARTLVQMGNFLVDLDPLRGLAVLEQARPLIPDRDPILLWLLESAQTECFIETKQHYQALNAFFAAEELRSFQPGPRADIRAKFTAGRLLEAHGYRAEAERLFEAVVSADLEHSLLKDAFLDLLYLFAFYVKGGESDRAADLGRRALNQLELLGSIHEQLRDVWRQLILAADRQSLDLQVVPAVRDYLRVWWKRPGPAAPDFLGKRA